MMIDIKGKHYRITDEVVLNELIAFINSEPLPLDYASYENEDDRAKFWQSAISCNELSDEKYAQIARVLGEPIYVHL